jgi:hypothetical protein
MRIREQSLSKQSAPEEGRRRIKNLKSKGYENCISLYKAILVKSLIFLIKLTFFETFFHILNRNLPLGMEVWPPGSLDINPFDYLQCDVSRRGINRSSHKKTVPGHHHQGGLQHYPQGGHQEGLQPLPVQAREGRCRLRRFHPLNVKSKYK